MGPPRQGAEDAPLREGDPIELRVLPDPYVTVR